jgi:hypothetical protein
MEFKAGTFSSWTHLDYLGNASSIQLSGQFYKQYNLSYQIQDAYRCHCALTFSFALIMREIYQEVERHSQLLDDGALIVCV